MAIEFYNKINPEMNERFFKSFWPAKECKKLVINVEIDEKYQISSESKSILDTSSEESDEQEEFELK